MVDRLVKRTEQSWKTLNAMAAYCRKRAELEDQYGKQLEKMGTQLKQELGAMEESLGTLPPVLLKLVTESTQMGAMRCQLKTQLDIEVVGALMELVEEDRKPAEQLKGVKSVTAACLAYRDYEANKLEVLKLAFVKFNVIESVLCEYQDDMVKTFAAEIEAFDPDAYVDEVVHKEMERAPKEEATPTPIKRNKAARGKLRVTFKEGVDVIGFTETESKMAPVVVAQSSQDAEMLMEIFAIRGGPKQSVVVADAVPNGGDDEEDEYDEEDEDDEDDEPEGGAVRFQVRNIDAPTKPSAAPAKAADAPAPTPAPAVQLKPTAPAPAPAPAPAAGIPMPVLKAVARPPAATPTPSSGADAAADGESQSGASRFGVALKSSGSSKAITSAPAAAASPAPAPAPAPVAMPPPKPSPTPVPPPTTAAKPTGGSPAGPPPVLAGSKPSAAGPPPPPVVAKPPVPAPAPAAPKPAAATPPKPTVAVPTPAPVPAPTPIPVVPAVAAAAAVAAAPPGPPKADSNPAPAKPIPALVSAADKPGSAPNSPHAGRSVIAPAAGSSTPPTGGSPRATVLVANASPPVSGLISPKGGSVSNALSSPRGGIASGLGSVASPRPSISGIPGRPSAPLPPPAERPLELIPVIQEILAAVFVDGEQKRVDVAGQVAFKGRLRGMFKADSAHFTLVGRADMDSLQPNKTVVDLSKSVASSDANEGFTFRCLLEPLINMLAAGAAVPLFRYRLGMTNDMATRLPVTLKAAWKCEPTLTSIIIQFRGATVDKPMVLKGVVLEVTVSGGVTGVQSKPDAVWDQTAQTARWPLGDVALQPGQEMLTRILARFVVMQPSTPSPLSVSFSVEGQVLSKTAVQISGEADQRIIDLRPPSFQLVTGKYFAIPTPSTGSAASPAGAAAKA